MTDLQDEDPSAVLLKTRVIKLQSTMTATETNVQSPNGRQGSRQESNTSNSTNQIKYGYNNE